LHEGELDGGLHRVRVIERAAPDVLLVQPLAPRPDVETTWHFVKDSAHQRLAQAG
jgi:hypothetical protein